MSEYSKIGCSIWCGILWRTS